MESSNASITVLLASVSPSLRTRLAKLLENSQKMHVVCTETENEVLSLADVHHPQIALLNLDIEWETVFALAEGLSLRKVRTLLIRDNIDETKAVELLQRHISGVIPTKTSSEMLCKSVQSVASGEIWISRGMIAQLVQRVQTLHRESSEPIHAAINKSLAGSSEKKAINAQASSEHQFSLTQREMQIVEAIGEGMTNKEISSHLSISKNTVKQHLVNIFDKCGVNSRLELAMFAVHHQLAGLDIHQAGDQTSPSVPIPDKNRRDKPQELTSH
jgi:two-component system, NarL family, nitrate/nitrite response regulator NarL